MSACTQPDCAGTVLADGYCDTCGTRADAGALPPPPPAATASTAAPATAATAPLPVGAPCAEAGCGGAILADGFCDTCGARATAGPLPDAPAPTGEAGPVSALAASARSTAFTSGSAAAGGSRRTRSDSTRTSSRRSGIGAGIVRVDPAPEVDPATVVMADPEVAERKRFCGHCGEPVGRSRGGEPGRLQGFCANCRAPFDFVPKLGPGDLVGGQYEVAGCLAHGGLGWIYLARDTAVSGRWVVLKGLLNAGDDAAMAAAVAERRFLAEVQHPNIVEIYNFTTHDGAGYTVMEYVGGTSLKQLLKARMQAAGQADPLDVEEAIAYVLAVLPAFQYLHDRGLVYCDFKPDNLIQVGDDVKLIDLGGVRRLDDAGGDIYGTIGFQAPEVPAQGVSIASDVYTIGRTLLVLTCDFRGYTTTHAEQLPDPADHPALRDHDPFWRLVRKACAPHPDDRFQSAAELADQLLGVLRIIAALRTGTPRPGPSAAFAGAPTGHEELPVLVADPADPAAGFLSHLPDDPDEALDEVRDAVDAGQVPDTVEVALRRGWLLVEAARPGDADAVADAILADDPWEWRAEWVRGAAALRDGRLADAAAAFDRCRSEMPGELAPIFASARVAEQAGETQRAAGLFDLVCSVDRAWTNAAFGLARTRLAVGDVDGALSAWDRVPATHRAHAEAEQASVTALADAGRVTEAATRAAALSLAGPARDRLDARLLRAALDRSTPQAPIVLADATLAERDLRLRLEATYRRLARAVDDPHERTRLVDEANAVRPLTVF